MTILDFIGTDKIFVHSDQPGFLYKWQGEIPQLMAKDIRYPTWFCAGNERSQMLIRPLMKSNQWTERTALKTGSRFRLDGVSYILAQTEAKKVALISLEDGNRWSNPCGVNNISSISSDEWNGIRGLYPGNFIPE